MAEFNKWTHANLVRLAQDLTKENAQLKDQVEHLKTDMKTALGAYRMEITRNDKPESTPLPLL